VKILQRLPLDLQARVAKYGVEILLKRCCDKGSTNGIKPIGAPKIWKFVWGVKKLGESDVDRLNPCGNQITHFIGWMESFNVTNFVYNCKKVGTISKI